MRFINFILPPHGSTNNANETDKQNSINSNYK